MNTRPPKTNDHQDAPMTIKTDLVGRVGELEQLDRLTQSRGDRHAYYVYGEGGLGKTRLLEELQKKVEALDSGYLTSGIIDLYHTDTHSITDIQLSIVNSIDPDLNHFPRYDRLRKEYVRKREQGVDPSRLESLRGQLSEVFVTEFNKLASSPQTQKVVLCFDTVEQLHYQSSAVEDRAGIDRREPTRLKPWLLRTLPQLHNALIVFAGRPSTGILDQPRSPHERFVEDLARSFRWESGWELTLRQLQPFTLSETEAFVRSIPGAIGRVQEDLIPVLQRLTSGRPIFLHLVLDLVLKLSQSPRDVLDLFRSFADVVTAKDDDPRLQSAREKMVTTLLASIFNDAGVLGGYLGQIALLPKGVNQDILQDLLGMPAQEASELLRLLVPLSFVKIHTPPRRFAGQIEDLGSPSPSSRLIFLQDEMYALLTRPGVMTSLRLQERRMSKSVISVYYDIRIKELEKGIGDELDLERRAYLRREWERLQVDRLYYLLVQDARKGYQEYKELTDQANRERRVGFAMRLRDEFMRFYYAQQRRQQFAEAGLGEKQVERETILMWVERFHWWARQGDVIELAERIVSDPTQFSISHDDIAVLANIQALLMRNRQMTYGPELEAVVTAQAMWTRLVQSGDETEAGLLARARLATSIGWQLDAIGELMEASNHYRRALGAFRKIGRYRDELVMLLNNMAYLYGRQGQAVLARALAREALEINDELRIEYSRALSLNTCGNIELMQGNYREAALYARRALSLLQKLEDTWGSILALSALAQAKRGAAKTIVEKRRKQQQVAVYEQSERYLQRAVAIAAEGGFRGLLPELYLDLGRVYRELGAAVSVLGSHETAIPYFQRSAASCRAALQGGVIEIALGYGSANWWESFLQGEWVAVHQTHEASSKGDAISVEAYAELGELLSVLGKDDVARHYLMLSEAALPPEQLRSETGQLTCLSGRILVAAGMIERLRGSLALSVGASDALVHFSHAFECFDSFSPVAAEKQHLVEHTQAGLIQMSPERQQEVMSALRSWVDDRPNQVAPVQFERIVQALIGQ